ncbi:MAG: acetylxylan esterase [Verrucomicrobiales bacterium]|nr:acetylxylan esterase [Verrucomicrobiales bacterium]
MTRFFLSLLAMTTLPLSAYEPIYDESEIPPYELPPLLQFENGDPVENAEDWKKRRAELVALFTDQVYGKALLPKPKKLRFEIRTPESPFLENGATMTEVRILFSETEPKPFLDLLLLKPKSETPTPAILALNFSGNHSIHSSTQISLTDSWMRSRKEERESGAVVDDRATDKARGVKASRWPVEKILESGVALATFYYGDVDPDFDDGFENGIHPLAEKPGPGDWGSIAAWAWGASRARDYLEKESDLDQDRIAIMGHSRLGKTALWAGALDERFSLVISNNSGCGGAALSRRRFGERVSRINTSFPHWFCDNFLQYNEKESELPVDQHQLIALIAPRMVYVASAEEDRWADPKGEFLAAREASPAWELLEKNGIEAEEMPEIGKPAGDRVRYHIRAGKHDVTDYDWEQYLRAVKESGK